MSRFSPATPPVFTSRGAELAALVAGDSCVELFALRRRQTRDDRPIFLRHEALDLGLAVADELQGYRLHAASDRAPGSLRHNTGDSVKPTR